MKPRRDGTNRWPAVQRLDAARAFRLALEKGEAGTRYHAVGEEGIPTRELAEMIGRKLKLQTVSVAPGDAGDHFGFLAMFLGLDAPASSAFTRDQLGWTSTNCGLIDDLESGTYFEGGLNRFSGS